MLNYFLKRAAAVIPTLFIIAFLNFFFMRSMPGGPADKMMFDASTGIKNSTLSGSSIDTPRNVKNDVYASDILDLEKEMGLNNSIMLDLLSMVNSYLHLDFGTSLINERKVSDMIKEKLPISLCLSLLSVLIVYLLAVPAGIVKTMKKDSSLDSFLDVISAIFYATPAFSIAISLIYVFSGGIFNVLPSRGAFSVHLPTGKLAIFLDLIKHLILPAISIALSSFSFMTIFCRDSLLREVTKPYFFMARAKGLSNTKALYKHAIGGAMMSMIASFPMFVVHMAVNGVLIMEIVFSIEGIGLLGFEAVSNRDYPVMMGVLCSLTFLSLVATILADLICVIIDNRINFESK